MRHRPVELRVKIGSLTQAATDSIPPRAYNPEEKSFQLPDMRLLGASSEIHAEAIPESLMPISEVTFDPTHQVGREANIIQAIASIERVHAGTLSYHRTNRLAVVVHDLPRDLLQVTLEDRSRARHSTGEGVDLNDFEKCRTYLPHEPQQVSQVDANLSGCGSFAWSKSIPLILAVEVPLDPLLRNSALTHVIQDLACGPVFYRLPLQALVRTTDQIGDLPAQGREILFLFSLRVSR